MWALVCETFPFSNASPASTCKLGYSTRADDSEGVYSSFFMCLALSTASWMLCGKQWEAKAAVHLQFVDAPVVTQRHAQQFREASENWGISEAAVHCQGGRCPSRDATPLTLRTHVASTCHRSSHHVDGALVSILFSCQFHVQKLRRPFDLLLRQRRILLSPVSSGDWEVFY